MNDEPEPSAARRARVVDQVKRCAVAGAAIAATLLAPAAEAADSTRYVSINIGRNLFAEGDGCRIATGAVTILHVAWYAASVGVPIGGNIVVGRTGGTTRYCDPHVAGGRHLYASWADVRYLATNDGFQPQTSGMTYRPLVGLTTDQQRYEACGALDELERRGYTRARGMFAAPAPADRPALDDAALAVVRECYVWARDYGDNTFAYHPVRTDGTRVRTNVRNNLEPRGYYRTVSLNAGSCPATADCWDGQHYTYMRPSEVIRDLRDAPPGSHYVLQPYRLVAGDQPGRWKCSGYASTHWSYAVETYCWADLKRIIDAIPADYVATDPLTVAQAWGLDR